MLNSLKNRWQKNALANKTQNEQRKNQRDINNALLGQDMLSDYMYHEIKNSSDFQELDEDRREEVDKMLTILNQHFKEHKIQEQAVLDTAHEIPQLYDVTLAAMQDVIQDIDRHVMSYEKFIEQEIKNAHQAFMEKEYNTAFMIANRAKNMAQPFALGSFFSFFSSYSEGADVHRMDQFAPLFKKLKKNGKFIKTYKPKFQKLYDAASEIRKESNARLKEANAINKSERNATTLENSPHIYSPREVTYVTENIEMNGWEPLLGGDNKKIGWMNSASQIQHIIKRSKVAVFTGNHNPLYVNLVVRPGEEQLYTLVDMDGTPLLDASGAPIGYFMFSEFYKDGRGKITGIGIKKSNDNSAFTKIQFAS